MLSIGGELLIGKCDGNEMRADSSGATNSVTPLIQSPKFPS